MLTHTTRLRLPSSEIKVRQIAPAIDCSFVVLCNSEENSTLILKDYNRFMHIDQDGKKVHEEIFKEEIHSFVMVSQKCVVFPLIKEGKMVRFDILTHKKIICDFQVDKTELNSLKMFYFEQTGLLCIKQTEKSQKLDRNNKKQPLVLMKQTWMRKDNLGTVVNESKIKLQMLQNIQVTKGNHHSLLIANDTKKSYAHIILSDLIEEQGKFTSRVRFFNFFSLPKSDFFDEFKIHLLWNDTKDNFVYVYSKNSQTFLGQFVLESNKQKQTIEKDKNERQISTNFLTSTVFFHNYIGLKYFVQGTTTKIKFIHIDPRQKEHQLELANKKCWNLTPCDYECSAFIAWGSDYSSKYITLIHGKMINMRQKYMDLLHILNNDFDDDLLMDVIEALIE